MATASFSSFAPGGPYAGFAGGLSAGYNFNKLIGVELDFGLGRTNLAAQRGCLDNNYYLGEDNILYYAAPLGIGSWSTADIRTRISYQRLGLAANVNILTLFPQAAGTLWSLALSPRISAYNTRQSLLPLKGGQILRPASGSTLHFGYGASVKLGYKLCDNIRLGFTSGITFLSGKGLDGIPDHGHKSNFVWESAIGVSYAFGGKSEGAADSAYSDETPVMRPEARKALRYAQYCGIVTEPLLEPGELLELPSRRLPEAQAIYFNFDKWELKSGECDSLQDILEALRRDGSLLLCIEGWCDSFGGEQVCSIISALRAEAVAQWFVAQGISADRISAQGKGIDHNQKVNAKARRVDVQLKRKSE